MPRPTWPSALDDHRVRHRIAVAVAVLVVLAVAMFAVVGMSRWNADVKATTDRARIQGEADAKARDEKAAALEQSLKVKATTAWNAGLVPITWPKGRPLTVEVYGDSVTYGMDATAEQKTYRYLFGSALREAGSVDYIVKAWPGAKAGDMVRDIDPRPGIDLSIIELGLNDAFKKTPITKFEADYKQQIHDIKAASPKTQILCEGLWQSRSDPAYTDYDESIEKLCKAAGGYYLRLSEDFDNQAQITHGPPDQRVAFDDKKSDSTHPNDHGMEVIAYRISPSGCRSC